MLSYYQNLSVGNTQCKNPYYGPHGNICHSINNWIYILEMFTICTVSALYSCVVMFVFLILPFCYFFYEEGDDDVTTKSVSNYVWIKFSKKMYWNWLTDRNWCLQKWVSLSLSQIKKKKHFRLKFICNISENMQCPEIYIGVSVHCNCAVVGGVSLAKYITLN